MLYESDESEDSLLAQHFETQGASMQSCMEQQLSSPWNFIVSSWRPLCNEMQLWMQVEFLKASFRDRRLARVYRKHAAIGGLGLCCFALEDMAISHGHHFVHSLWHLNACYAVASTNALMQKREESTLRPAPAN